MLALKKKKAEAEKKALEEARKAKEEAAAAGGDGSSTPSSATAESSAQGSSSNNSKPAPAGGGLSLFGVGGVKRTNGSGQQVRKRTPGELRIQKDIAELDGGNVATIDFPNPNDLTKFGVTVKPDTGYWAHATYQFEFEIPGEYPHKPPRVKCNTRIYHPNIDLKGNVCLNILREEWKPVLDINAVIYGLIYLFYEPNPDDPLNHEAAELLRRDKSQFKRLVSRTLRGGILDGEQFERMV